MTVMAFSDILKTKVFHMRHRRCVMSELPLFSDQVMKHEQYKDLLREAEHYRLIKIVPQQEPEPPQNTDAPQRRTLVDLARRIPNLGLMGHVRT
jgi:hypothetical protein